MASEWVQWHQGYEGDQPLSRRLRIVQDLLRRALDAAAPGTIRLISMCAGDGRDLLGVLPSHPRGPDVSARLVELDPDLVSAGRKRAERVGLAGVTIVQGDAGDTNAYAGAVPANIVLACGVFGNVTNEDIQNTVAHLPELCAEQASVIWTRGRFEPDLTPSIRGWFADSGFLEQAFVPVPDSTMSVGHHRLAASPRPFQPDQNLFTFLPADQRPSRRAQQR